MVEGSVCHAVWPALETSFRQPCLCPHATGFFKFEISGMSKLYLSSSREKEMQIFLMFQFSQRLQQWAMTASSVK